MMDFETAKTSSHRRNLERYYWLLGTNLTELERQYILNRIAEETAELERLELRMVSAHGARLVWIGFAYQATWRGMSWIRS
jgi:hypothetical protein